MSFFTFSFDDSSAMKLLPGGYLAGDSAMREPDWLGFFNGRSGPGGEKDCAAWVVSAPTTLRKPLDISGECAPPD